jgi:hypothetical protein
MTFEHRTKRKHSKPSISKGYRLVWDKWLETLLTDGSVTVHRADEFFSFSFTDRLVRGAEFGDIKIVFDLTKLRAQGITPIDYDAIASGIADPAIIEHVTGYTEEDYYDDLGVSGASEALAIEEPTWQQYLQSRVEALAYEENEFLMKKVTYEPGLILHVILPQNKPFLHLKKLLRGHGIPYEIGGI